MNDTRFITINWTFIAGLLLLLIGANTYLSLSTIDELSSLQVSIKQSGSVVKLLEDSHVNTLAAESSQRAYLLTENALYLQKFTAATTEFEQLLKTSKIIEPELEQQSALIAELFSLLQQKHKGLKATVEKGRIGDFRQAIAHMQTEEGMALQTRVYTLFDIIKDNEIRIRDTQIFQLNKAKDESTINLIISVVTSSLLLISIFFLAIKNIRNMRDRELFMQQQNEKLTLAVEARTQELSLFSDELARSNRELEDFAFVASHDLQEPLRKIMAFGDRILGANNLSEKQSDYLQRMRAAAQRMSTLISDLLEFSRVSSRGKDFEEVDLNIVMNAVTDDLNVLIEECETTIEIGELPILRSDPTQIHQLLSNLMGNAIKFSNTSDKPRVAVTASPCEQPEQIDLEGFKQWYRIDVQDNGIGFEQQHEEQIFAPFQRLHSRSEYKGTGIGLAICRRIVERHNGVIESIGEPGEGATFSVYLPVENRLLTVKNKATNSQL